MTHCSCGLAECNQQHAHPIAMEALQHLDGMQAHPETRQLHLQQHPLTAPALLHFAAPCVPGLVAGSYIATHRAQSEESEDSADCYCSRCPHCMTRSGRSSQGPGPSNASSDASAVPAKRRAMNVALARFADDSRDSQSPKSSNAATPIIDVMTDGGSPAVPPPPIAAAVVGQPELVDLTHDSSMAQQGVTLEALDLEVPVVNSSTGVGSTQHKNTVVTTSRPPPHMRQRQRHPATWQRSRNGETEADMRHPAGWQSRLRRPQAEMMMQGRTGSQSRCCNNCTVHCTSCRVDRFASSSRSEARRSQRNSAACRQCQCGATPATNIQIEWRPTADGTAVTTVLMPGVDSTPVFSPNMASTPVVVSLSSVPVPPGAMPPPPTPYMCMQLPPCVYSMCTHFGISPTVYPQLRLPPGYAAAPTQPTEADDQPQQQQVQQPPQQQNQGRAAQHSNSGHSTPTTTSTSTEASLPSQFQSADSFPVTFRQARAECTSNHFPQQLQQHFAQMQQQQQQVAPAQAAAAAFVDPAVAAAASRSAIPLNQQNMLYRQHNQLSRQREAQATWYNQQQQHTQLAARRSQQQQQQVAAGTVQQPPPEWRPANEILANSLTNPQQQGVTHIPTPPTMQPAFYATFGLGGPIDSSLHGPEARHVLQAGLFNPLAEAAGHLRHPQHIMRIQQQIGQSPLVIPEMAVDYAQLTGQPPFYSDGSFNPPLPPPIPPLYATGPVVPLMAAVAPHLSSTYATAYAQAPIRASGAAALIPLRYSMAEVTDMPQGATAELISAYTVVHEFAKRADCGDEPEEKCTICLCEFEAAQNLRCLPCTHTYHVACIDRWLYSNKRCPICRLEIDSSRQQTAPTSRMTAQTQS